MENESSVSANISQVNEELKKKILIQSTIEEIKNARHNKGRDISSGGNGFANDGNIAYDYYLYSGKRAEFKRMNEEIKRIMQQKVISLACSNHCTGRESWDIRDL